jgi:4-hydroxymandelate oxidase
VTWLAGLEGRGADAVFPGRLPLWALVEGEPGVARMHADLLAEPSEAFRLAGCRTVADARGIAVPRPAP